MQKSGYSLMALVNFVLGVCAACLYLPYTLSAFNVKGDWYNFAQDMLKDKYTDVFLYFTIVLLAWILIATIISFNSKPSMSKILFKVATISAVLLPLIYAMIFKYEPVAEFWTKNILKNIKTISNVLLCVSLGSFGLALIFNFSRSNKANFHHMLQSLAVCAVLVLTVATNGWCGWKIDNFVKLFGILMAIMPIYLIVSTFVISSCKKRIYR